MKFIKNLSVAALAAVAFSAATTTEAQSIDVRVTGSITPPACSTSISNGGVLNFRNIAGATLNLTSPTRMSNRASMPFGISCAMPTQLAIRVLDNRADSIIAGITNGTFGFNGDAFNFGLGSVGGQNVGGYTFNFVETNLIGAEGGVVTAYPISSGDGGLSWASVASTNNGAAQKGTSNLLSWSETNDGLPAALRYLTGQITAYPTIAKGADLPLKDEIPLDGSATVELVYL